MSVVANNGPFKTCNLTLLNSFIITDDYNGGIIGIAAYKF